MHPIIAIEYKIIKWYKMPISCATTWELKAELYEKAEFISSTLVIYIIQALIFDCGILIKIFPFLIASEKNKLTKKVAQKL